MRLKSLEYSQFLGEEKEWKLTKTAFGDVNLIVGKNANGKTRTVNVISSLSGLLSGKKKPTLLSGNYKAVFEEKGKETVFVLKIADQKVVKEELTVDGMQMLKRGSSGRGKIFNSKEKKETEFQTPQNELTANSRRDSVQHPFFEPLYEWATSFSTYYFGTPLGKDTMVVVQNNEEDLDKSLDQEAIQLIAMFRKGRKAHGKPFVNGVIKDMKVVGYDLEDIGLDKPTSIISSVSLLGLYVKERGLPFTVDQNEISQGMFRALSLIIQINYLDRVGQRSCVLIDDIGEGLDFERSTNLINLLIQKAEKGSVQLIMSTNDRFIMNNVPLKYWSVIQRTQNGSKIFNYQNSKKVFDEFNFTGLNNFDFFSKDFFETGLEK